MTVTAGNQPRGRFVFKKQNKIRWRPSEDILPSLFVCGSWDDLENEVTLWNWCGGRGEADTEDKMAEPQLLASFDHKIGDVTEIQFLYSDLLAVSSSDGSVSLLRIVRDDIANLASTGYKLVLAGKWDQLHKSSSCNGVTSAGEHIISVGYDGKMFLLNAKRQVPVKTFPSADSGSLSSALFLKQDEVAASNARGQVKLWDLRSNEEQPVKICQLSMDLVGVGCLAKHPTQPHIMVGGGTNGTLAFWDLRSKDYPLSVVKAHPGAVSEVHFHDQQPDHLFTCSQNGDVWHWNGRNVEKAQSMFAIAPQGQQAASTCFWLNSDSVKHRVDTKSLMAPMALPANSMSVLSSSVLVAGDSEAIFVIPDIGI